jgi:hypothetical protein
VSTCVVELVGRRHSRVTYCLSQLGQFSIFNLLEMKTKYPYHVASLPFYLLVFFCCFQISMSMHVCMAEKILSPFIPFVSYFFPA